MEKLTKITRNQIAEKGVQSLADRPNAKAQYGIGGLSPQQLKLSFDQLATFLAEKINELIDTISSDAAANYIRIALDEYGVESLQNLIDDITSGEFAAKVLQIFPSVSADETISLQQYINEATKSITTNKDNIIWLETMLKTKLNLDTSPAEYKRVYIIDTDGSQNVAYISNTPINDALAIYSTDGQLEVATPLEDKYATNRGYVEKAINDTLGDISNVRRLPLSKGEADPSLVVFDGTASGKYSISMGSDDKSILGDLSSYAIPFDAVAPKVSAPLAIAFGMNSTSNATGATAIGIGNTAGICGYYWHHIDFSANKITLSINRPSTSMESAVWNISDEAFDWDVGDYVSIVNDSKYPFCAQITAKEKNVITVDTLPFSQDNYIFTSISAIDTYLHEAPDDRSIFAINRTLDNRNHAELKVRSGSVKLGWGANSFGFSNVSGGSLAFSAGMGNVAPGDFGAVFGRDNISSYAALVGGTSNNATGRSSVVGGNSNNVKGDNAICGGNQNTVTVGNVITGGYKNTVHSGSAGSIVGGDKNTVVSSWDALVAGQENSVKGNFNNVSGRKNAVEGTHNAVFGLDNIVNCGYSVVGGEKNVAEANRGAIFGYKNHIKAGACSILVGDGLNGCAWDQAIFGRYNVEASDALFIIGNGTSDSTRSNAFEVKADGRAYANGEQLLTSATLGTRELLFEGVLTLDVGTISIPALSEYDFIFVECSKKTTYPATGSEYIDFCTSLVIPNGMSSGANAYSDVSAYAIDRADVYVDWNNNQIMWEGIKQMNCANSYPAWESLDEETDSKITINYISKIIGVRLRGE